MNSRTLPLIGLNLRSAPFAIWIFPAALILFSIPMMGWFVKGDYGGFSTHLVMPVGIFFSLMAGASFLLQENINPAAPVSGILKYGEFLITRPISRCEVYRATTILYFAITLAPLTLSLALSTLQPDMTFSLYKSATQQTEASKDLASYQQAFPEVLVEPGKNHDRLCIPNAKVFVQAWQLWVLIPLSLLLQLFALLRVTPLLRTILLFSVAGAFAVQGLLMVMNQDLMNSLMQAFFFFFVRHWIVCCLAAVLVFALVQSWAFRRVRNIEVV